MFGVCEKIFFQSAVLCLPPSSQSFQRIEFTSYERQIFLRKENFSFASQVERGVLCGSLIRGFPNETNVTKTNETKCRSVLVHLICFDHPNFQRLETFVGVVYVEYVHLERSRSFRILLSLQKFKLFEPVKCEAVKWSASTKLNGRSSGSSGSSNCH